MNIFDLHKLRKKKKATLKFHVSPDFVRVSGSVSSLSPWPGSLGHLLGCFLWCKPWDIPPDIRLVSHVRDRSRSLASPAYSPPVSYTAAFHTVVWCISHQFSFCPIMLGVKAPHHIFYCSKYWSIMKSWGPVFAGLSFRGSASALGVYS